MEFEQRDLPITGRDDVIHRAEVQRCIEARRCEIGEIARVGTVNLLGTKAPFPEFPTCERDGLLGQVDERNAVAQSEELDRVSARATADVGDVAGSREMLVDQTQGADQLESPVRSLQSLPFVVDLLVVVPSHDLAHRCPPRAPVA